MRARIHQEWRDQFAGRECWVYRGRVHGHATLSHEHIDTRGGETDIKLRADSAHFDQSGRDDKGARGILGDGEESLTAHQPHCAAFGRKINGDFRARVEFDP